MSKIDRHELYFTRNNNNEIADQQRVFMIFIAEKTTANVVSKRLKQKSWYPALIDLKEARGFQDKTITSQSTSVTVQNGH